jgi:hypothetical protein
LGIGNDDIFEIKVAVTEVDAAYVGEQVSVWIGGSFGNRKPWKRG